MRFFGKALCAIAVLGLITGCAGATLSSPASALPNVRVGSGGIRQHLSMIIPCHCPHIDPAKKGSHKAHRTRA